MSEEIEKKIIKKTTKKVAKKDGEEKVTVKKTTVKKPTTKKTVKKDEVKEVNVEIKVENEIKNENENENKNNFLTQDLKEPYHGFAIISAILGIVCMGAIWFSTTLSLVVGLVGALTGLISIGKKRSTIGVAAIAINMISLSVLLLYFIICMVLGISSYALT
jgi:hypothetical protein